MTSRPTVEHAFDTPYTVNLFVENGSGLVALRATRTESTKIHLTGRYAEQATVSQDGDAITVVAPRQRGGFLGGDHSLDIEVTLPATSRVVVKTGSADVTSTGALGATKVKSGSGKVELEEVGDVAVVDTGSGDIRIGDARAELRLRSGSGDIAVDTTTASAAISTGSGDVRLGTVAGPLAVKTGSGDLEVAELAGDVTVTTGSGDTVIRTARRGRISTKGASGDLRVGVPAGTPVWTDVRTVSGQLSSSVPPVGEPEPGAEHVELRATTVSGNVALVPA